MQKNPDSSSKFRTRFERSAARWAARAKRLGIPLVSEVRKEAIYQSTLERRAQVHREADSRFEGCTSLTDGARQLRMRRTDLTEQMEREGWLARINNRWRATQLATDGGWLVERGPAAIRYAQVTPDGVTEIARRMGIAPGA
ncbi:hypothetical protein CUJ88_04035 [Paraburkholderia hospita]|nr:hypothetical protein CUJ88_04035 [Paraburkholderia hospita]